MNTRFTFLRPADHVPFMLLLALLIGLSLPGTADAVVLVDDQQSPAPIVVNPDAAGREQTAAQQLSQYLEQISGQPFPIERRDGDLPERAIVLGVALEEVDGADALPVNGYILRTAGRRVYITAGGDIGLMYGVFRFLEEIGCQWWTRNEEHVPSMDAVSVDDLDLVMAPPFDMHELMNLEASRGMFQYKVGHGTPVSFTGGHNLCGMLRPYAEEHPEFLPMNEDGERKFNNLHMNYTADAMPEALATELAKEVDQRDGNVDRFIYFAGMGDWYGGMDMSEESRRIYEEETWVDPDGREKPGYSATLLQMINETAALLEEDYPGIKVGTFAYMSLEAPPAHTTPRDNVYIWLPRLRHCTVHSITECEQNQSFLRNLERWTEIAPGRVYIWEYGANYNNFLMPFANLRSIAENLRVYAEMGVAGVRIQGNYVSTGGDLAALKNWVWGRLLWEPTRDVDALLEEFCHGYYGPAGSAVIEYVNTLENFVREPELIHADEFRPIRQYIDDEMLAGLRGILEDGLAAVEGDATYERRVREVMASVEAAILWRDGPLEERDGKLVRTDIGDYTWPRALSMVEHLRGASPREWGNGPAYHQNFLRWHGGPVANLTHGPLHVKVEPVQIGRSRVLWDDQPVIASTIDRPNQALRVGMPDDDFGDDNASFTSELGLGNWSSSVKQKLARRVELDGGTVRMIGTLQQVASGDNYATGNVAIETRYPAASPDALSVEYRDADGQWHAVTPTPASDSDDQEHAPASEGVEAFRVTLNEPSVVVLDRYLIAEPGTGRVEFDAENSQVVTVLNVPPVTLSQEEPREYAQREITVQPAE